MAANDADGARHVAAVTGAEKVGNGELAELAQVGREQQRHQHIAAGPAHDEGQAVITRSAYSVPAIPMKDAADIQSAPVAMPLNKAGTRRPAT